MADLESYPISRQAEKSPFDADEILRSIDIIPRPGIVERDVKHQVGVGAEESARTVRMILIENLGKERARKDDRMAASAVYRGTRDPVRRRAPGGEKPPDTLDLERRQIDERHERARGIRRQSADPGAKRREHAERPVVVLDDAHL